MKLAILGGKQVRNTMLTYGRQCIDEEDISRVNEVLRGDYLTTGPYIKEFEDKVAKYVGAKYAVAVSSGTAALHMACFAAEIGEGDEVIVSPMTFAASANCVLYCGGKPVFADIDSKTHNLDPSEIEKHITDKTKAIIPVDYSGQSVDIDAIRKIADKHGLIIIEDAAHALGSEYKGNKVGTIADMTEFSFHPVKPITTGEGGVVVTNNKKLYNRMMLFRTHGITRESSLMEKNDGPWYYEQIDLGFNYRITDIQCALGSSQMNKIDKFLARRKEIVAIYNKGFKNTSEVITPYEASFSNSGWHIYVLELDLEKIMCTRKEVFEALKAENIGVNVHYLPVYLHPYYMKLGYKKGLCPNAEKMYDRIVTLPLHPGMTSLDVNDVIEAVIKVINYYSKRS